MVHGSCTPPQGQGWLEYKIDDQQEWTMGYFVITVGMMAEMMNGVPEAESVKDPTATMMSLAFRKHSWPPACPLTSAVINGKTIMTLPHSSPAHTL